jgi:hypothetical protein
MRISIASTEKIVIVQGLPMRVWEGQIAGGGEADGVHVYCFIHKIHPYNSEIPANRQKAIKEMGSTHLPPSHDCSRLPEVHHYKPADVADQS